MTGKLRSRQANPSGLNPVSVAAQLWVIKGAGGTGREGLAPPFGVNRHEGDFQRWRRPEPTTRPARPPAAHSRHVRRLRGRLYFLLEDNRLRLTLPTKSPHSIMQRHCVGATTRLVSLQVWRGSVMTGGRVRIVWIQAPCAGTRGDGLSHFCRRSIATGSLAVYRSERSLAIEKYRASIEESRRRLSLMRKKQRNVRVFQHRSRHSAEKALPQS